MPKKNKEDLDAARITQVLLAGLLLKDEPRPDVRKLERLIKVKDGTLSDLFPQRAKRRSKPLESEAVT